MIRAQRLCASAYASMVLYCGCLGPVDVAPVTVSNPRREPSSSTVASAPTIVTIVDAAQAEEIVRQVVGRELHKTGANKDTFPVFKVTKFEAGFRVFVQYGTAKDAQGTVMGFYPGGHSTYVLSVEGKVVEVIGGR